MVEHFGPLCLPRHGVLSVAAVDTALVLKVLRANLELKTGNGEPAPRSDRSNPGLG